MVFPSLQVNFTSFESFDKVPNSKVASATSEYSSRLNEIVHNLMNTGVSLF